MKMANIFKKMVDKLSGYSDEDFVDYDEDYDYDNASSDQYEEEADFEQSNFSNFVQEPIMQPRAERKSADHKVVPLKSNVGAQQLIIIEPDRIESAKKVIDHLRSGHTVICNIERVDRDVAQRVIDYISGSVYAMDGSVKPIDSRHLTFVAAPRSVTLLDKETAPQPQSSAQEHFRMAR